MPAQKRSLPESNSDSDREEGDAREKSSSPHQNGHSFPNKQTRHLHPSPSSHPPPSPSPLESGNREDDEEEEEVEEQEEDEEEEEEEEEGDEKEGDDDDDEEVEDHEEKEEGSGGSKSSSSEDEKPEFINVELREIRKDVQCPICLGIIRKTRTVMECLHRFCRECIDKSMRMGNNECPACRTHCASRRSLRDDPNYDALIAALYPDIDEYEEDELTFHEEEMARNKQIQASIAQVIQRQSEALVRRRPTGKETGPFTTRTSRTARTRRRRNSRGNDFQGSEDNEEENDDNGGKDSSSADERPTELRQRRRRRRSGARTLQPSSSAADGEGVNENDSEASRENRGISPGLVWNTEMLAWGRGGARSHTRHGSANNCNNKNSRSTRISKLVDYLKSLDEKNDELDVHLKLISLDNERALSLQKQYLCCRPSLSVKHLCKYVARQTPLQSEEVEIMLVKGEHRAGDDLSSLHPPISPDELQVLKQQDTLGGLKAGCISCRDYLILAYRNKKTSG